MAPGLREYYRLERFYTNTLANAKQFMDGYDSEQHSGQLEGWKQRIEGLFKDFQTNRLAIEVLEDVEDDGSIRGGARDDDEQDAVDEKHRLIHQKFELDYVLISSFLTKATTLCCGWSVSLNGI